MRARKLLGCTLFVDGDGATICLFGKQGPLRLIDTNLKTTTKPLSPYRPSLTATINRGERKLIALTAMRDGKYRSDSFPLILEVIFGETHKEPIIDLEKTWIPHPERFGEIVWTKEDCCLRVMSEDKFFTNSNGTLGDFISEQGLLCGFMLGEVTLDDLEKHAEKAAAEESARSQLAGKQAIIDTYTDDFEMQEEEIKTLQESYDKLRRSHEGLCERHADLQKQLDTRNIQYHVACNLANALTSNWYWGKKKYVKSRLSIFNQNRDK